jgi:hypothetical protein
MQIIGTGRDDGKSLIMTRHEPRQEGVTVVHVVDAGQAQILDKPVLQGSIGTLDPALRLAQRILMFSSQSARPNWVMPWPPLASFFATRNTECLSE